MHEFGRILIIMGVTLTLVGALLLIALRLFPDMGNLPGDFTLESGRFRFYLPFAAMIILSVLGTIILNIIIRIFR